MQSSTTISEVQGISVSGKVGIGIIVAKEMTVKNRVQRWMLVAVFGFGLVAVGLPSDLASAHSVCENWSHSAWHWWTAHDDYHRFTGTESRGEQHWYGTHFHTYAKFYNDTHGWAFSEAKCS